MMDFEKSLRIVNSPSFRWIEGMLAHIPDNGNFHTIRITPPVADNWNNLDIRDCLPDTEDSATIGCLLNLVGAKFDLDAIVLGMEHCQTDVTSEDDLIA
jgi:hypothetical protein